MNDTKHEYDRVDGAIATRWRGNTKNFPFEGRWKFEGDFLLNLVDPFSSCLRHETVNNVRLRWNLRKAEERARAVDGKHFLSETSSNSL